MKRKTPEVQAVTASANKTARRKVAVLKSSIARMEQETSASNALNERGVAWHIDLVSQLTDVHVDDVRLREQAVVPNILQEHCASNYLAGMAHEIFQKLELARQQIENALTPTRGPFDQIHHERPHPQGRGARFARSAQQSLDACCQFIHGEGLRQVVIATRLQSTNSFVDRGKNADHKHRNPNAVAPERIDHRQ